MVINKNTKATLYKHGESFKGEILIMDFKVNSGKGPEVYEVKTGASVISSSGQTFAKTPINPDAPLPHSNSAAAMARIHHAEESTIPVNDVKGFLSRLGSRMQAETIIQRTSGGNPDLKAVMSNVFYGTAI